MDKIIITEDDEKFLTKIKKELGKKDSNEGFSLVFSIASTFQVILESYNLVATFYMEKDVENIIVEVERHDGLYLCKCKLNRQNLQAHEFEYNESFGFNPTVLMQTQSAAKDLIIFTIVFMYVLNNYKDFELITVKEVKSLQQKPVKVKKKKTKKSVKNVVRVVNKVLRINPDAEAQKKVTRHIKRKWHVDEFNRRGHWRTYKSGKRVWVKATKVKTKAKTGKIGEKEYRL